MSDLAERLWTGSNDSANSDRLLEQYKLYVEMADRVSQRRGLTNTFFLTLNTAVFAVAGSITRAGLEQPSLFLLIPLAALIIECVAWFALLRSYRLLNTAKYEVIGAMEERLPASPYWRAEWKAPGEGTDRRKYWPLSHLEQWIPVAFGALYGISAVLVIVLRLRHG